MQGREHISLHQSRGCSSPSPLPASLSLTFRGRGAGIFPSADAEAPQTPRLRSCQSSRTPGRPRARSSRVALAKISQPLKNPDSFRLHASNKSGSLYSFVVQGELDLLYANQLKTGNTSLRRKTVNHQLLISLTFSPA